MALNIFLIDDDADDRDVFREALYEIDPKIVCSTAIDGRKALSMLNHGVIDIPDVIFLDLNMPGMTGWEFLAVLKESPILNDIPVIIYSTSTYSEDILKAQKNGALCFYSKPSRFNELKTNLATVVDHLRDGTLAFLPGTSDRFLTPANDHL